MGDRPFNTSTVVVATGAAARISHGTITPQALKIVAKSEVDSSDTTISKILDGAMTEIFTKVHSQPNSFIMTRDELAVLNFFQHQYTDGKTMLSARK